MKIKFMILPLCAAVVILNSCAGVSAEITIKADGSGKIALEYRVSQALESLGRLDGNEGKPVIPVGKTDFERSVSRIAGLKLSGYSSKDVRGDSGDATLVTKAALDFKDTGALLAFLDSAGSRASIVQEGQGNLLRLTLMEPSDGVTDPDLLALLREISKGCDFSLSFNLPGNASIATVPASVPGAKPEAKGKKASFSIGMGELLNLKQGLVLEIRW